MVYILAVKVDCEEKWVLKKCIRQFYFAYLKVNDKSQYINF